MEAYRLLEQAAKTIRIERHCDYFQRIAAFEQMDNALYVLMRG